MMFVFFFTLYTTSAPTQSPAIFRGSLVTLIAGCISERKESDVMAVVGNFVSCCEQNHLQLNMTETGAGCGYEEGQGTCDPCFHP